MTTAVCVSCGSLKWGAFNPCSECSFRPSSDIDLAYSLALTDHYFDTEVLEQIGESIKNGDPRPSLPTEQEDHFLRVVQNPMSRRLLGK